jgi:hypothetical protein
MSLSVSLLCDRWDLRAGLLFVSPSHGREQARAVELEAQFVASLVEMRSSIRAQDYVGYC